MLSFASGTLVATPKGLQPIASLKVGGQVTAYDPSTHKASVQTVQHTYINHDNNLLAVTLRTVTSTSASQGTADSTTKQQGAAVAAHGAHAPPNMGETIQTTSNHPWLTADHGWILASFLHVGELVQRVDGSAVVVVAVRTEPGVAAMWDITVSNVHTFGVGDGACVVHNCPDDLQRYGGKKPGYEVNPVHDPKSPRFNPHKTPLPDDAEQVYKHAVPDDPTDPNAWYGKNANGDIYGYQGGSNVHFNGSTGWGSALGDPPLRYNEIPRYARLRLG